MSTAKLTGRYRDFPYVHTLPVIKIPHQMVCLLQLMNFCRSVMTTPNPYCSQYTFFMFLEGIHLNLKFCCLLTKHFSSMSAFDFSLAYPPSTFKKWHGKYIFCFSLFYMFKFSVECFQKYFLLWPCLFCFCIIH